MKRLLAALALAVAIALAVPACGGDDPGKGFTAVAHED